MKRYFAIIVSVILIFSAFPIFALAESEESVLTDWLYDLSGTMSTFGNSVPGASSLKNLSTGSYKASWGPVYEYTYTNYRVKTGDSTKKIKVSLSSSWEYPGPASNSQVLVEMFDSGGKVVNAWVTKAGQSSATFTGYYTPPGPDAQYYFRIKIYGPVANFGSLTVSNVAK